jgi:hypothetical protein
VKIGECCWTWPTQGGIGRDEIPGEGRACLLVALTAYFLTGPECVGKLRATTPD